MTPEELKAKRRQILIDILGKSETIVELKEIKELLAQKELKYTPDTKLVEAILKLVEKIDEMPEIPKKIESPVVNLSVPERMKVDWENMPKTEVKTEVVKIPSFLKPIEWLKKQLETFLSPFLNRIISLISEPDRTEIQRTLSGNIESITDYYGKRKVVYKVSYNNSNEIQSVDRSEK